MTIQYRYTFLILACFCFLMHPYCIKHSYANDLKTIIVDENYPNLLGKVAILDNEINANIVVAPSYTLMIRRASKLSINGNLTLEDGAALTGNYASLEVKKNLLLNSADIEISRLTVGGSCTVSNNFSTTDIEKLTVAGDFIHSSGTLTIGRTVLTVGGDFRAQQKIATEWTAADVYFYATSAYSKLIVAGNIIVQAEHASNGAIPTPRYHEQYSTIIAQKDIYILANPYFHKSIEKINFTGNSEQKIYFKDKFYGTYLTFNNPSKEGIEFLSFAHDHLLDIKTFSPAVITGLKCSAELRRYSHLVGDFEFSNLYISDDIKIEGNVTITNYLSYSGTSSPSYLNEDNYDEFEVTKNLTLRPKAKLKINYPTIIKVGGNLFCDHDVNFDFTPFESLRGSRHTTTYMQELIVQGDILLDENVKFQTPRLNIKLKGNFTSESPVIANNLELIGNNKTDHTKIAAPTFTLTTFKHNCVPTTLIPNNLFMIDSDSDGYFDFEDFAPLNSDVSTPIDFCPALTSDFDKDGWDDTIELAALGTTDYRPEDDFDNDGLPNSWEVSYHLDPQKDDGKLDSDNDGITNEEEFATGRSPIAVNITDTYPNISGKIFTLKEDIAGITIESGYTVIVPEDTSIAINGDLKIEPNASLITYGTVIVTSNLITAGTLEIAPNSTITANGIFSQKNGTLNLGGSLTVSKDFSVEGSSFLNITEKNALLNIRGSVSVETTSPVKASPAQCLIEVGGNISVAKETHYFDSGVSGLKLSGSEKQTINFLSPFQGTILSVDNALENGITFTNFSSENILTFTSTKSVSLTNTALKIKIDQKNKTTLEGDTIFKELYVENSSTIKSFGNLKITKKLYLDGFLYGTKNFILSKNAHLSMHNAAIRVDQDFIVEEGSSITAKKGSYYQELSARTFDIHSEQINTDPRLSVTITRNFINHNSSPLFFKEFKIWGKENHTVTTQGIIDIKTLTISFRPYDPANKNYLIITAPYIVIDEVLNYLCVYLNFNTQSLHSPDSDDDGVLNLYDKYPFDPSRSQYKGICPAISFDLDKDGLFDSYEFTHFGSLQYSSKDDPDNDSLLNITEFELGTNPSLKDSDQDGMPDSWEVTHNINPLKKNENEDDDNDGITNYEEYLNGTDPTKKDSTTQQQFIVPIITNILLS